MAKLTDAQFKAEIARLQAENAALKKAKAGGMIRVSQKGAVSVYGLGRWPVTLYASQWDKLFSQVDSIQAFIKANKKALSFKDAE